MTNMSDRLDALPHAWMAQSSGFRSDNRFTLAPEPEPGPAPSPTPEPEAEDPVARAFADGFAAGVTEAAAHAEAIALETAAAREGLALALDRLDAALAEDLRLRLRDTVAALCEAALAPYALDEEALMRRIDKAVAMFARADDERVIRLNPQDIAFLDPRFAAAWHVEPDPALPRGALRVETPGGGVEDGPEQWRRTIAEVLHQC